jgi:hypothetical protein
MQKLAIKRCPRMRFQQVSATLDECIWGF